MREKTKILIEKAIVYRIVSFLISTTVLYLFMGSVKKVGAAVIIIETFKTIEFYFFDELFTKYTKRRKIRKV